MIDHFHQHWKSYVRGTTAIAVLCLFLWALAAVHNPNTSLIQTVTVKNVPAKYQSLVKAALKPYVSSGLFTVDLNEIQTTLEGYPWVSQVQVERIWPHQLLILVKPQRIVAHWGRGKVLNDYGEVFSAGSVEFSKALPTLTGPLGSQWQMLSHFQQASAFLKPVGQTVSKIMLGQDGDWRLILSNGLIIQLGRQQVLTRLAKFVKVYPKIFRAGKKAVSVDLRYPSGMAIRWQ